MTHDQTVARGWPRWRIAGWGFAIFLLLVPFVAMQMTRDVNWTAADFLFAAVLFGSVGLAIEYLVRKSNSVAYRWGAALAVIAAVLTVWVNAAVGMIGAEDNPHNLLFGAVLFVALAGSILARFEARGMCRVMVATAIAQVAVAAAGLSTDQRGAMLSMGFAIPWLLAAALFRSATASHGRATKSRNSTAAPPKARPCARSPR